MIGEFTKRVVIKNPTVETSVTGGTSITGYTTISTVWAKVDQKSGGVEIDSQIGNKQKYEIEFRYSSTIAASISVSTVLNDGTNDYSIINIDTDKRYYKILCVTK